jgi:hypothetical protein
LKTIWLTIYDKTFGNYTVSKVIIIYGRPCVFKANYMFQGQTHG